MRKLSRQARIAIIREVLDCEIADSEGTLTPDEEESLLEELQEMDAQELEEAWSATVGEWLASEGDDPEWEWETLLSGRHSSYPMRYNVSWRGETLVD